MGSELENEFLRHEITHFIFLFGVMIACFNSSIIFPFLASMQAAASRCTYADLLFCCTGRALEEMSEVEKDTLFGSSMELDGGTAE